LLELLLDGDELELPDSLDSDEDKLELKLLGG
jgi:hypothetical protein